MIGFLKYVGIISLLFCLYTCKQPKPNISNLKSIFINGNDIHHLDIGKGESVVFVHGGLGDYRSWSQQMDTFSEHYRVITYSRRYAYPNKQIINDSADYTILPHVEDLAELIKNLSIDPVHLVGHSWGAFTALKTTIDHPELIKSLVLGEPPVHSIIGNTKIGDSLISHLFEKSIRPSAKAFKKMRMRGELVYLLEGLWVIVYYIQKPQNK